MGRTVLLDGKIKFIDCVNIRPDSPALNFGAGIFETILYENGKIFFLEEHVERLVSSCKILKIRIPAKSFCGIDNIVELIRANGQIDRSCRIKIMYSPLFDRSNWNVLITVEGYEKNIGAISAVAAGRTRDNEFYRFKTNSYMENFLHIESAPESEILFLNSKGNIIEGARSNILCVKDNVLFYTDFSENYLQGIMQSHIISDHKEFGFSDVQAFKGGFGYEFIKECSDVYITNSLIIARPCSSVKLGYNTVNYNISEISENIRKFYLK